jgi:hypothetical protein
MFNLTSPDSPDYLPLFNDQGEIDPSGQIACRTCHLTHGRHDPLAVPLGLVGMETLELRARKWHIRAFGASNVCTSCHGTDALRRYMYFHDPQRRGGPIETRAPAPRRGPATPPPRG